MVPIPEYDAMDQLQAFGARVRELRQDLSYTQDSLAELTGLHRTYIGGIERGERNVALKNILLLAEALECSPSELLACYDNR